MDLNPRKSIIFSDHARQKMVDRGASENEVETAIRKGIPEPARKERLLFRKNFSFNDDWRGKHFAVKQVAPVVSEEEDELVVVTVFVFYF
jgi:hypothetical protein